MKGHFNIYAALIATTIIGCTEEIDVQRVPAPSDVEILPNAAVAQSRSDLTGAQDGPLFPASTDNVFAVSAFLSSNGTDADIPYFLNQPLKSDAEGNFHFYRENGLRYYPEDSYKLYFYAFSPACATQDKNDPKKVSWTLTGQEDIMYAKDLTGLSKNHEGTQPQPTFNFQHLLTRLNFRCRRETGFADYI